MNRPSQSLARGSILMLFSMSTAGALSLVISIVIARMLGVTEFGVYSVLVSIQAVVAILAMFSIGPSITKHISEYRATDPEQALKFAKAGMVLVFLFSLVAAGAYVLIAGFIGNGLYDEPRMAELIPYSALVVISNSALAMSVGIVQGCQEIRLLAEMQVTTPALNLTLITVFLILFDTPGIFVGYFLSQMAVAFIGLYMVNRKGFRFLSAPLELRSSPTPKKLLSFALPAMLGGFIVLPVYWIGNTELALGPGFQAVGFFAVAFVVFQALTLIPNALVTPLFPRVSELSKVSHAEIQRIMSESVKTIAFVLFPFLFTLALFARPVIVLLYGSSYGEAADVVFLMVGAGYFYALNAPVGGLMSGLGRMWMAFGMNAAWAGVFIVASIVAIPHYGAEGLAIAYVVSYAALAAVGFALTKKYLNVDLSGSYLGATLAGISLLLGFIIIVEENAGVVIRAALAIIAAAIFLLSARSVFESTYLRVRHAFHLT